MSRSQFPMLDQSVSTLNTVDSYLATGMETVVDCAQDLSDIISMSDDSASQMGEMKDIMHKFVEMKRDLQQYLIAIDYVKEQCMNSDDAGQKMLALLNEKLNVLRAGNTEEDIIQHEMYTKISTLQKQKENEEKNQNNQGSDEEIAITQEVENTRCAITGKEMTHPVRNTVCGHNYDRQGIEHYLSTRPNGKCPMSGCSSDSPVQQCNLVENKDLKRYIDKRNRAKSKRLKRDDDRISSISL